MSISYAQRDKIFGRCDASQHVVVKTPWGIAVRVHRLLAERFKLACERADQRSAWKPHRIDGYACRDIRGSTSTSLHSYAIAWDFFATDPGVPPPGGVWKPDNTVPDDFAAPFIELGFRWGRYFSRQDWPHIEWPHGIPDPLPAQPTQPTPEEEDMGRPILIRKRGFNSVWQIVPTEAGFCKVLISSGQVFDALGYDWAWVRVLEPEDAVFTFPDAKPSGDLR